MTPERFQRLEALFDLVADLDPAEQVVRVRDACGEDAALARDMLRLLGHDARSGGRIAAAIEALILIPEAAEPRFQGRRLGPYRVIRELGRGGMGVVFEAVRDDDAFEKRVALKVAPTAAYSEEFLERFRQERQVLASLEHPHIARLLDGGTTDEGIPFFVMELVSGEPILQYVQARRSSIEDRIHLFLQVCDAVEYAHQNLVVHRDLKPAHILVTGGSVRLLDFGVAKLLEPGMDPTRAETISPMTPAYCSPEQLRREPVTTRSDVYSLGLVLYELLTGERARAEGRASPDEAALAAPLPSVRARVRGDRTLSRRLRGDLDAIVQTATRPDAAHRYRSAAAFADDLRLHLEGRPIHARLDSRWYVAGRFVRRRWLPLSAAALLIVSLIGGVVATTYQARRAERRFQQVRRIANTLMLDVHQAIRDLPASTKAQEVVVRTALEYLDDLARDAGDDVALQAEIAEGYLKVGLLAYSFQNPSLGRPDEARASYLKASTILDRLAADGHDDARLASARVVLDHQLGELLYVTGQSAAAFASFERAIAAAESALLLHGGHRGLQDALADALASIITRFDARSAVNGYVPRYLSLAEESARQHPRTPESISELGVAYSQAGRLAAATDRTEEARRYFRRNIDLHQALVERDPQNTAFRRNLMLAWSNLADLALGPLGTYSSSGAGGPPAPLDPASRQEARSACDRVVEQAEWLYASDPENVSATFDYAVGLGRCAPSFPPGDRAAIDGLTRSLALLDRLASANPAGASGFIIEFRGSLAERFRQAGLMTRAEEEWRRALAIADDALALDPDNYLPRRQVLPMVVNRALALARSGDRVAAMAAARRAEQLAEEVAAREAQYQRASGWLPRVHGWLAEFHTLMGDQAAAARARETSLTLWRAVAARDTLPDDLLDEARAAVARAGAASR